MSSGMKRGDMNGGMMMMMLFSLLFAHFALAEIMNVSLVAPSVTPSSQKWSGIAKAPNGKMFAAPYDADHILVFNPQTNASSTFPVTVSGSSKWSGIALAHDRKLYCAPYNADSILVIDPKPSTPIQTLVSATMCGTGTGMYVGVAVAHNGKVYFAPFNANQVMVYDPSTADVTCIGPSDSTPGKYAGIVYAITGTISDKAGRLFCAPYNANAILYINPDDGTAGNLTSNGTAISLISGTGKYHGIAAASTGKLFAAPFNASRVLVIDPRTNATSQSISARVNTTQSFQGVVKGVNGKMFFAPYDADYVLLLDSISNKTQLMSEDGIFYSDDEISCCGPIQSDDHTAKWSGIAISNNDKMIGAPFNDPDLLIIGDYRVDRFLPFAPLRIIFTTDIGLPPNVTATIPITFHKTSDCEDPDSRFLELSSLVWSGRPNETLVLPLDKMVTRTFHHGIVPQEEEVFFCFHVIYKGRLEPAPELVSAPFWISRMLPRSLILMGNMHCSSGNSQNGLYGGQNDGSSWRCFDGVLASERIQQEDYERLDNQPVTYNLNNERSFQIHDIFAANDYGYIG